MDSTRRHFLKQILAGTAAGALATQGFARKLLAQETLKDSSSIVLIPNNWDEIRKEFALSERLMWFNTATIGLMPKRVMEATQNGMTALMSGSYSAPKSLYTTIADSFGAKPEEIAVTHNTTNGINIVAQGLPLKRGDEVILTDQEHAGNAVPWLARAQRDHLTVRVLEPGKTVDETMFKLGRLVNKKTKVIALPHITCTTGQVLPIKEISRRYQNQVPYLFFDGAHGPGTSEVDLHDIGCGFYAACGHKWLCGPAGTGFLYLREDLMNVVSPMFVGAGSDEKWELNAYEQKIDAWSDHATRFEYGTNNRALREGFEAAILFQKEIGFDRINARIRELSTLLRNQLKSIDWLEILTPEEAESSASILTFRPKDLSRRLPFIKSLQNSGTFRIREVRESGLDAVRISTHLFNAEEEILALGAWIEAWKGE